MKNFLLLTAFVEAVIAATYSTFERTSYSTSYGCSTVYRTVKPSTVATVYSTTTVGPDFVVYTHTSTPYTTVTPSPVVIDLTRTVSTSSVKTLPTTYKTLTTTKQFGTTTTAYHIVTISKTAVATSYTTVTNTSTIAAPSGFIPIYNSTGAINDEIIKNVAADPNLKAMSSPKEYEYEVRCLTSIRPHYIIEVLEIIPTHSTTLARSTTTSTITHTATKTGTKSPSTSTTRTIGHTLTSTTHVSSTTSTTTKTTTSTTVITAYTTATTYAACASNNILIEFGQLILFAYGYYLANSSTTYSTTSTTNTAYDCCVSCIQNPACDFTQFQMYELDGIPGPGTCTMFMTSNLVNGTCAAGQPVMGGVYGYEGEPEYTAYSNGGCASWRYAGLSL